MVMPHDSLLPYAAPESQGIASSAILGFVEAAEQTVESLHSFMLLRHGHVLAEGWWAPYEAERPHMLFSLSKSFTSSAIGLAVAEGLLSVDDRVLSFFPEHTPAEPSANLAAMRVHDLLSMSTGHDIDTTGFLRQQPDGDWVKAFFERPVEHTPGTYFVYNSGATYMLSAIIQRLTGTTLLEYLRPRLLAPLGIEQATWETCPRGINTGGWGLSIRTADIARFGQLYLQKGIWQGQQLLPKAWVEAASQAQVDNPREPNIDWRQGYGYQFWRCRHGAYRGDGAFGQYCIVMPEQDAVLAITSGLGNMQPPLDLVWEHLLPAMQAAPLPEDRAAQEALERKLAQLALPPQQGQASSPLAQEVSGRTYRFEENEQDVDAITLEFNQRGATLIVQDSNGTHTVSATVGSWLQGSTTLIDGRAYEVAASGAWTSDDTYVMRLCFNETPFIPTLTFRFSGDQLTSNWKDNVSFGPTEHPDIVGRAE
jgi:CubicO group peptidase (beta-lactamase class C family)